MVRPTIPATALLATSSASAYHRGSHENLSTLIPDVNTNTASMTDTATAMPPTQTPSGSLPKVQDARCQKPGHTQTNYASTATVYSFHDPQDGSAASAAPSDVDPEEKEIICYKSTTTITSPDVTTAAVVVESPISPHASTTAGPLTTHNGGTYAPVTTISKGGAGRPRIW